MILEQTDSGLIEAPVKAIFHCFWRAELWPKFTDHVVKVEMLEEQQGYQRYAMHVQVEGKKYVMETQRIAVAPHSISFQQPKPPVLMNAHSGLWTFEEGPSSTRVSVAHRVDLNEQKAMEVLEVGSTEEARQKILGNLHRNGMAMIRSIDEYLKSQEGQQLFENKLVSYAS
jgi:aromatase